jgi:hypothetical protein
MTQEVQSPPSPSPSTSAHYLNDVEVEHNLIRFNSRQDLANHVDVLIDAHPDLVFNYQRMAESDDPVVASIARYRLAQVHLELGCALDEVSQQFRQQHERAQSGLESMSQIHLEQAGIEFEKARGYKVLRDNLDPLGWQHAFSALVEPVPFVVYAKPRRPKCPHFCCNYDKTRAPPSHGNIITKDRLYAPHNSTLICSTLETEYLGPLEPFIY